MKGQDGLCEQEAAGREADMQSHVSEYRHACARGTHATYQTLQADNQRWTQCPLDASEQRARPDPPGETQRPCPPQAL